MPISPKGKAIKKAKGQMRDIKKPGEGVINRSANAKANDRYLISHSSEGTGNKMTISKYK